MVSVTSFEFLDARFKRLRFELWQLRGNNRMMHWQIPRRKRYAAHVRMLRGMKRISECPHGRTEANPGATVVLDMNPRVCLDCGVGLLSAPRTRLARDKQRRAERRGA